MVLLEPASQEPDLLELYEKGILGKRAETSACAALLGMKESNIYPHFNA